MSAYIPVTIGETHTLRAGIESILSPYPDNINDRLQELDATTIKANSPVTFASEVEFQFVDDPSAEESSDKSPPWMYEDVVMAVLASNELGAQPVWNKGAVIAPGENLTAIMFSDRHSDQGEDIIEVRTAPAHALEAIERYWRVILAIGCVAQAHGKMGLILSTHMNTAVNRGYRPRSFVNFNERVGGKVLASIQHNLQAVNALQLDAGLEAGVAIQEAYPTKDATTSIHPTRLELRHPAVGVIDPRIDILAVLDGVERHQMGHTSVAAQKQLRRSSIYSWTAPLPYVQSVMNESVLVDDKTNRLVLPAMMEYSAYNRGQECNYNTFGQLATGDPAYTIDKDYGSALRAVVNSLSLSLPDEFGFSRVQPNAPLRPALAKNLPEIRARYLRDANRTLPHVIYDSPESHVQRRRNLGRSATVRRIFSQAVRSLTNADEAVAIRKGLIDSSMVVSDEQI